MASFLKNHKIAVTIFLVSLASIGFFFRYHEQEAKAATYALTGWAWSENIGWISFNCANENSCGTSNYAVSVDDAGNISGYAWSENIGWISFNTADVAGCPSGTCTSTFNKQTGVIDGWAKALVTIPGWDGFIHFKGTASDGSSYGVTATGCNWDGYAWGGNVPGWIHFKGTNYGVRASGNACQTSNDLIVSQNPAPDASVLAAGATTTFTGIIKNQGTGTLTTQFGNQFRIDINNDGDPSNDVTLPLVTINGLNGGVQQSVTSAPWTMATGTHRIILCADQPNSTVDEYNKTNNCSLAGSGVFTVLPALTASCTSPASAITQQPLTRTVSASGGVGSAYTYQWSSPDNLVSGTGSSTTVLYTTSGSKQASVVVTSSSQTSGTQTFSASCPAVTIYQPTLTISPAQTQLDFGGTQQLTATFNQDGLPGHDQDKTASVSWYSSATSTISVNTGGLTTGNAQGAAVIYAHYTDQYGNTLDATANVTVNVPLLNATCSASRTLASTNQSITWTAAPTGGNGTYSYTWQGTDTLSGSAASTTKSYTSVGTKSANVTIVSGGQTKNFTCSNTVSVHSPSFVISPSPATVAIGGTTPLTGIYNPYGDSTLAPNQTVTASAVWSSSDRTKATVDANGIVTGVYPTAANTPMVISATYTDASNNVITASTNVTVTAPPLAASCSAKDANGNALTNITLNQPVIWTITRSGGTGTYTYAWSGDVPAGSNTQTVTTSYATVPASPTAKSATTTVTSGIASQSVSCGSVNVYQPSFVVAPGSAAVALNGTRQLQAFYNPYGPAGLVPDQTVTGSAGTAWSSDDATVVSVNNTSQKGLVTGNKSGNTIIRAAYADNFGNSIRATSNVTVQNAPPIAVAKISTNGNQFSDTVHVTRGIPATIYLSATGSDDPNGWSDPNYGMAQGGKCEWNSNLVQGTPFSSLAPFKEIVVLSPASPADCAISLGTLTFNDTPGVITYQILRLTDAAGATSSVANISVVVDPPSPITGACSISPAPTAITNQPVTWTANPSGGIGIYSYVWSGTDNLTGSATSTTIGYTAPGLKTAQVIVSSGNPFFSVPSVTLSQCSNLPNGIQIFQPTLKIKSATMQNLPVILSLVTKDHLQLKAQFDPDGPTGPQAPRDVTLSATWSTGDGTVAAVDNASITKGNVTGIGAGQTTITATITDAFGNVVSDTAPIKVVQPTLRIDPQSAEISLVAPTNQVQLRAIYSDNGSALHEQSVNANAVWGSADRTIASVDSSGLVTGRTNGTVNIFANYTDGLGNVLPQASTNITVTPNPRLSCFPATQRVFFNEPVSLSAAGGDGSYGWSTPNGAPAIGFTFGTNTLGTRFAVSGSQTVTVSSATTTVPQTASCTVVVGNRPTLRLDPPVINLTTNQRFVLHAWYDPDGPGKSEGANGDEPEHEVSTNAHWDSSNSSAVIIDQINNTGGGVRGIKGLRSEKSKDANEKSLAFLGHIAHFIGSLFTNAEAQTTTNTSVITATFTDPLTGETVRATTQIAVFDPTFSVNPTVINFQQPGQTQQIQAFYDPDGPSGPAASVPVTSQTNWTSSNPSASVGNGATNKGFVTAQAGGSSTITATYVDPFGNSLQKTVSVSVGQAPLPPVVCNPTTQSVLAGQPATFNAVGGNNTYQWSALDGTPPGGTGDTFKVNFASQGTHQVSLTSGTQTTFCSAVVALAVYDQQTQSILAPSVPQGTYSCTGNLGNGNIVNGAASFAQNPPTQVQTCTVTSTGIVPPVTAIVTATPPSRPIQNFREVPPE